jgi:hypothetical protein
MIEKRSAMIAATEDKAIYTFWKGRTALYAILKAMDLGPGDVVLLPGYTCMVVPSAVMFLGAVPIYADVDAASYNVNQETLEAAWRKHSGLRPKAIIIQHTYGIPVEAEPIIHWARDEGLVVIEDCAHVVSSRYHEKACGSLGDAAFFSSQWSKPICTGLGGWGVANNPALADRLRRVRESFLAADKSLPPVKQLGGGHRIFQPGGIVSGHAQQIRQNYVFHAGKALTPETGQGGGQYRSSTTAGGSLPARTGKGRLLMAPDPTRLCCDFCSLSRKG